MAKTHGAAARYVSDQTRMKRLETIKIGLATVAFSAAIAGFLMGRAFPKDEGSLLASVAVSAALLVATLVLGRWCTRKMDSLERERLSMQRGADGEASVARVLDSFPDEFHIVHDLTTTYGNIDHVVIGPTGVFLIDAKNWRGLVTAGEKGELLVNGRPTTKPDIRNFVCRVMNIRDRVKALAPQAEAYFHALFVFTSARVDAKWGTTGNVTCLRDDQLFEFIVERNFGKRLSPEQVTSLAQAFIGLAHMDRDFTERSAPVASKAKSPMPALTSP
jgi:hypothetical protein